MLHSFLSAVLATVVLVVSVGLMLIGTVIGARKNRAAR